VTSAPKSGLPAIDVQAGDDAQVIDDVQASDDAQASDDEQVIDDALLARVLDHATRSQRGRTNHNFHRSLEEQVHRFLNAMLRDTYVRPHRHLTPPKPEAFLVLRGEVALLVFDEGGAIKSVHRLSDPTRPGPIGIDIPAGPYHSLVVLSDSAVIYEVKPGPYVKQTDKAFAPWAPAEGTPRVAAYLSELRSAIASGARSRG
jgi:cupin fold WbuC family metalloprotein